MTKKKDESIIDKIVESNPEKKSYELSIAGFKLKLNNTIIAMLIPAITTIGGSMWGVFEFYKDYMDMKAKIQKYVAPDLSQFDKRLSIIEQNADKNDGYTRDIKNNLQNDIRRADDSVNRVDRNTKSWQRDTDQSVNSVRSEMRDLRRETENSIRQIRHEVDSKIQKAMDNPLNNR